MTRRGPRVPLGRRALVGPVAALAAALAVVAAGGTARAQRSPQQVLELNRQAMEAYTNLEIEQAQQLLEQARAIVQQNAIHGMPAARTYMNLGVVSVGGLGDNATGLDYFVQALQEDPSVQLDPLTSNPDMQTLFNIARQRAGGGGTAPTPPTPPPVTRPRLPAGSNIPHEPVAEQLAQTAVPVFIAAPADAPVGAVKVFYKSVGMRAFREAAMQRIEGGFGFEVPCAEVFEPSVQYYIVAYDENGDVMGFVGSASDPVTIPIVTTRTQPAPSLPGYPAPEPCRERECPPGMPGCGSSLAGLGETCRRRADCSDGLLCEDGFCVTERREREEDEDDEDEGGDEDGDEDGDEGPRFFLQLGGTLGFGYARNGIPADQAGAPPEGTVLEANSPWVLDDGVTCDPNGDGAPDTPGDATASYCVQVRTAGFVPTFALRAVAGYYFTPRFGAAFSFRLQPTAGESSMAAMLLGLRLQYLLTEPVDEGLATAAFLGTSFGQIQLQVPQPAGGPQPFALSGLNGAQLGAVMTYRFVRNFGLTLTPEVHVLFPILLLNVDVTAGLELSF